MEAESPFEVGHVLFIDVVGYSKLLIDDQREVLHQLKLVVRGSQQFCTAEAEKKLVCLPTGDGMVLAFFGNPEAPARCAIEIAHASREYPYLRLRMGIHSGPVSRLADVNERANIAGSGINLAQRVMDCGDAGHILLSQRVAEDLSEYREWNSSIHDLGQADVKHGVKLHLFNFFGQGFGNPTPPSKLAGRFHRVRATAARSKKVRPAFAALIGLVLLGTAAAALFAYLHRSPPHNG